MKRKRSFSQNRLFTQNNPASPRICPELAGEIGLNESILLLQYEFWIATEGEEREGHLWVRKTVREIKTVLSFWGTGTINRIIQHLIEKGYCVAGEFDEDGDKNGRWIRFDFDTLLSLKSIKIISAETGQTITNDSSQVGTNITPDGTNNETSPYIGNKEYQEKKRENGTKRRTPTPYPKRSEWPRHVQMYFTVTERAPARPVWPLIEQRMGQNPDPARLRECYATWLDRGHKEWNNGWLDWYVTGIPERVTYGQHHNGRRNQNQAYAVNQSGLNSDNGAPRKKLFKERPHD